MATQIQVPITPGSGQNIDATQTTTAGNSRQVIVIGDPATDAAVAPVSATLGLLVNNTAGTAIMGKVGIDQTTPGTTNAMDINGLAVNTEQTPASNGAAQNAVLDLVGKQIVMPYANKENFVAGTASATGTSGTSVISAQGAGIKIYITSISVANTGSTASLLTIQQDPAGTPATLWQTINPAGGGSNFTFPTPIVVAANKAVGFTAGSSSTTQYVSISGYIGS